MNTEIIPAIMPESYNDLVQKAGKIAGIVPWAQIDVMDGEFTASRNWPYGKENQATFQKLLKEKKELPFWDELAYEVDLMVAHPEKVVRDWVALGARRIIVHIESVKALRPLIASVQAENATEEDCTLEAPVEFGLAFNIDTPFDRLQGYMYEVDVVQLMGIAKIGFQGEPFDERVLARIRDLRAQYPHLIISIDGGVNRESAPRLIEAGADRLVSGSAVFGSSNVEEAIASLAQQR